METTERYKCSYCQAESANRAYIENHESHHVLTEDFEWAAVHGWTQYEVAPEHFYAKDKNGTIYHYRLVHGERPSTAGGRAYDEARGEDWPTRLRLRWVRRPTRLKVEP